jgi:hypothetical protein
MAKRKYEQYVKGLNYTDGGFGSFRQGVRMDSEFLGMDVCIEYGT